MSDVEPFEALYEDSDGRAFVLDLDQLADDVRRLVALLVVSTDRKAAVLELYRISSENSFDYVTVLARDVASNFAQHLLEEQTTFAIPQAQANYFAFVLAFRNARGSAA